MLFYNIKGVNGKDAKISAVLPCYGKRVVVNPRTGFIGSGFN